MGIMEKNIETAVLGYVGFRVYLGELAWVRSWIVNAVDGPSPA